MTLPQFDVLSELERAGEPLTMSQLSRELMVSNGNVTGVIDRLEKSGLVARNRADHDRRIQYIDLTSQGRKDFDKMARHHARWLEDLFAGLSLNDMSELQKLLLKTRHSVTD
ncbi:MAG: MarR family transcriptional regulator [Gammaproteobacteria bacterium]|nr:MarR family transcriptional regulator [Gammaproteobacteria bacterium]